MSTEIRTVGPDELEAYVEVMGRAFLGMPHLERMAEFARARWDLRRTWAAFDGDRPCGSFRSFATELTVPGGGAVPASGVSAVTVLPTHRRRGLLTRMAAAEHAAIRERGEVVALLYASEYGIYGRFGYGPSCRTATWTLDASATEFRGAPVSGVEIVAPGPEVRDAMIGVFDAWRARQPGEIRRDPFRFDDSLGLVEPRWGERWRGFTVLHRDPTGEVDGYARYQADERWERSQPAYGLRVDELHALTDEGYAALWRFLAETDLVATVVAQGRSPSERLPWLLTNARAATVSDIGDGMWVRVFDVARALEARAWGRPASIVLEVVDEELGAPVRVALDASPDGATCRPTRRSPDLTLPVAAIGAVYLGGTRLRDAVTAMGGDEHREGALTEADALFRTADEPWCSTHF